MEAMWPSGKSLIFLRNSLFFLVLDVSSKQPRNPENSWSHRRVHIAPVAVAGWAYARGSRWLGIPPWQSLVLVVVVVVLLLQPRQVSDNCRATDGRVCKLFS